ncbi:hypothetical protein [Flavobacterium lacus]|uniref:Secreted protein with PEP-CTERM sorting signal n=1 Tax=Flavobacterium lacus TaxID=1353778 RepID=A0A328WLN8_9FLAO|nr:hypothetical protein [Flavobacterium lacus]RAR47262.1 hypothetical protein B0I10_11055 [Flavobacterium lacus]
MLLILKSLRIIVITLLFCLLPHLAMADDSFDEDTDDLTPEESEPPGAPIDDHVGLVFLLGIAGAFYFIQKKQISKEIK